MKLFTQMGRMSLGTRVRVLGETFLTDAAKIYGLYDYPIKMNPKWLPVFFILSKEGEKTITAIAQDIGHSHVSVSKIVREMVKAKLVVEKSCREDGRRTLVSLSQAGREAAEKIEKQYEDVGAAVDELTRRAETDLWKALEEWESLLAQQSMYDRVLAQKRAREGHAAVKVVPYAPKYRAAFRDLNVEWIKKYFKMEEADYKALDNPDSYILKRGGSIFVALLNGEPVGVCALLKREDKKFPLELAKMAVSPRAQGKGAGFLLGLAVIEKARELGAKKLFLESNTILGPAIHLYRKLGFQEVTGVSSPYERCNIQMELELRR